MSWVSGDVINSAARMNALGQKAWNYLIRPDGSDFEALDQYGKLAYGGSSDAGGVDGSVLWDVYARTITELLSTGGVIQLRNIQEDLSNSTLGQKTLDLDGWTKSITTRGEGTANTSLVVRASGAAGTSVKFYDDAWVTDPTPKMIFEDLKLSCSNVYRGFHWNFVIPIFRNVHLHNTEPKSAGDAFRVDGAGAPGGVHTWSNIFMDSVQSGAPAVTPYFWHLHMEKLYINNLYVYTNGSNIKMVNQSSGSFTVNSLEWLIWGAVSNDLLFINMPTSTGCEGSHFDHVFMHPNVNGTNRFFAQIADDSSLSMFIQHFSGRLGFGIDVAADAITRKYLEVQRIWDKCGGVIVPINYLIATPFLDGATDLISFFAGTAVAPTASTTYEIVDTDILINSTNSGGADCNIVVKDSAGNAITHLNGVTTLVGEHLDQHYTIDWGAFTGADPTVQVIAE